MFKEWRLIRGSRLQGGENMAIDEALLSCADGCGGGWGGVITPPAPPVPVIRLYGWKEPTISIGYLQDAAPFLSTGLPVVRRITGGRAVLHDMEVTYSVIAPADSSVFQGGIMGAYSVIGRSIAGALNDLDIGASFKEGRPPLRPRKGPAHEACFHSTSRYEVSINGRKVSGSAQRRFRASFLQHGSILFDIDEGLNTRVFGRGAAQRMAWVREFGDATEEDFMERLIARFEDSLGVALRASALTREEEAVKDGLLKEKYSRDEWNHGPDRAKTGEWPVSRQVVHGRIARQ